MHNYLFFNIALTLICLFYGSFSTHAKTFKHNEVLQWDVKPQKIIINAQTEYQLIGFKGAHFSNEQPQLAQFIKSYPVDGFGTIEVSLQNEVFETVSNEFIPSNYQKQLNTSVEIKSKLEKARNQYYVDVRVIPFQKLKNGQLQKLVSFQLVINFNPIQKKETGAKKVFIN